ncbi:MAG: hypothetical protein IBX62_01560 [Coriobacteriia bacterium]|nr:hypothetical protein [Coriobacteriia bacterium]
MLSSIPLTEGPLVAVDIEATGARPGHHEVIEIGAVRIEAGRIADRYSSLVRTSGRPIPPVISTLTAISDAMLAEAPGMDDVLETFRRFADGAVLVAHNHRFDLGFLDYESELRWGEPFPRPVLDTLALARRLHPAEDRHNLRDLAARYRTRIRPIHRAGSDAEATAEILIGMTPHLLARGLETAGEVATFCGMDHQGDLSRKLSLTTRMPPRPGLYLFRDRSGRVVHVGRARDLRARTRSYFYGSIGRGRPPVAAETEAIQWIECASELDALLLESRLVTRYRPEHNSSVLRGDRGPWLLTPTTGRFPGLRVASRPLAVGAVGPFASEGALEAVAAQLRREHGLRRCTRRLTRRTIRVHCDHRDDGTCPRPCVEDCDEAVYAARVRDALAAFSTGEPVFRQSLRSRLSASATAMRYEEAIRYRDTLKAYDRSLSALRTVEAATRDPGFAIVEGDGERVVLHLVRHGHLAKTLRLHREESMRPEILSRLHRVLTAYFPAEDPPVDPRLLSPRALRDVFLISAYRAQHGALEVPLTGGPEAALRRLRATLETAEPRRGVA